MNDERFLEVDTAKLRRLRRELALSQQKLADMSGVTQETISRLERGRNLGRGLTLRKLAEALGVSVQDLTKKEEKVSVRVRWEDGEGRLRGESLRFTGKVRDTYERGDVTLTLYECPDGFRVHEEDGQEETSGLYPSEVDTVTGEVEYPLYSAEELAEEWPMFGATVGEFRIRDLD